MFKRISLIILLLLGTFIFANQVSAGTFYCLCKNSKAQRVSDPTIDLNTFCKICESRCQALGSSKDKCTQIDNDNSSGPSGNTGANYSCRCKNNFANISSDSMLCVGNECEIRCQALGSSKDTCGPLGTDVNIPLGTDVNIGEVAVTANAPIKFDNPLNPAGGSKSADSIPQLIGKVIDAILGVVGSLALLMFVFGGLTWMTSSGNPEKVKKGRDIIIWSAIGLAVIFLAYALTRFILSTIAK